jgi:molybdate-binding protein/transcriptional regulator with XRE-family HTH domain
VSATARPGRSDDRFRLARLARGLSQSALADAAGVTRQAISGVESGRWSPSLEVALALTRALGTSVEELFGSGESYSPTMARAVAPGLDPRRLLLATVDDRQVAYPLSGDNALVPGFRPAVAGGGECSATGEIEVQPFAAAGPTVAIAGCDPALALLAGPLAGRTPALRLAWWSCPNDVGIELLEAGLVHAAAVHRRTDSRSVGPAAEGDSGRYERVGFARWREGLVVAPQLADRVTTLADVLEQGLRLANREPGSEARRLVDDALSDLGRAGTAVNGYDTSCSAHLLVASAIAAGLADAGVASEPAALAYGLGFYPWQDEICELWMARRHLGTPELRGLLDVLAGDELPAQLSAVAGYDASPCGRLGA